MNLGLPIFFTALGIFIIGTLLLANWWTDGKVFGRKKYSYLIAFNSYKDYVYGSGMTSVNRDKPIESYADVLEVANAIVEHEKMESVVITNYILLDK